MSDKKKFLIFLYVGGFLFYIYEVLKLYVYFGSGVFLVMNE